MVLYNNIYPLDELKYAQKWLLHAGLARNVSQTLGDPPRLGCINLRIKGHDVHDKRRIRVGLQ